MPRNAYGIHEFADNDPANGSTISDTLNLLSNSLTEGIDGLVGTSTERDTLTPAPEGVTWTDTDSPYRRWIGRNGQWVPETAWTHQAIGSDAANFGAPAAGLPPVFKTGYVKVGLSGGLYAVTFPSPFPNRLLHVSATTIEGSGTAPVVNNRQVSPSGFQLLWNGAGSAVVAFTYLAIGY